MVGLAALSFDANVATPTELIERTSEIHSAPDDFTGIQIDSSAPGQQSPSNIATHDTDWQGLCRPSSIRGWALVGIGHATLLFGYITFVVVVSLRAPMPAWQRAVFIALASVLNVAVFACYWMTMATPAGNAPATWKAPEEHLVRHETGPVLGVDKKVVEVLPGPVYMRDRAGQVRFCRACKAVRPDRSYHCNTCGGCTLRFDHHCPWMNKCIGHRNYKLFYLFTFYGTLLAIFYVASTLSVVIAHFDGSAPADTYVVVLDMVLLVWTFLFGLIFVGGLFVQHTYLIVRNKTTYERLRPQPTSIPVPAGEVLFSNGVANNWVSVMGSNPILWLVPVPAKVEGDGCTFPLNKKCAQGNAEAA